MSVFRIENIIFGKSRFVSKNCVHGHRLPGLLDFGSKVLRSMFKTIMVIVLKFLTLFFLFSNEMFVNGAQIHKMIV